MGGRVLNPTRHAKNLNRLKSWEGKRSSGVYVSKFTDVYIQFYFRTIRYVIVSICLFFLVFFWSIPVVIVSSMVSLQALQKQFSFLKGGK
jgi:hypothetical protein